MELFKVGDVCVPQQVIGNAGPVDVTLGSGGEILGWKVQNTGTGDVWLATDGQDAAVGLGVKIAVGQVETRSVLTPDGLPDGVPSVIGTDVASAISVTTVRGRV